ncbi:hypothetical protein RB195_016964 [Necator americanus]|uniref:Uncharacterized protein n=1 Tax=Necator americanus TaxID=51031 RepID=A0ABR1C2Y3_NECAM
MMLIVAERLTEPHQCASVFMSSKLEDDQRGIEREHAHTRSVYTLNTIISCKDSNIVNFVQRQGVPPNSSATLDLILTYLWQCQPVITAKCV